MNPFVPQMPMMPQHTVATTPFDSIFGQMSLNPQGTIPQQLQTQPSPFQPNPQMPSQLTTDLSAKRRSTMPVMDTQPFVARQASVSHNEMRKVTMSPQNTSSMRPQKTGTMNPFSIPSDFDDPKPVVQESKKPTLNDLALDAWKNKQSSASAPAAASSRLSLIHI